MKHKGATYSTGPDSRSFPWPRCVTKRNCEKNNEIPDEYFGLRNPGHSDKNDLHPKSATSIEARAEGGFFHFSFLSRIVSQVSRKKIKKRLRERPWRAQRARL